MVARRRTISAALTLFFVAPLVAEYLLGDLPLTLLPALLVLAPAYGGGALLIRETARRAGRGWPTMLLLGAAYALCNEGLVTQSLFNPDYLKLHLHLLDHAYIPAWGIGAWWTLFMLNLHPFWSMGVSIALVEALFPAEAEAPWLGLPGEALAAAIFVLGAVANLFLGFRQNHFVASPAQLTCAAVLTVLLIACAFVMPAASSRRSVGTVPGPWITGAITLLLGMGVLYTPPRWGWGAVGGLLFLDAAFLTLVHLCSRRASWSPLHALSIAAGGALSYGVHAFTQRPLVGGVVGMRISNTILLAAALWLVSRGAMRVRRNQAVIP